MDLSPEYKAERLRQQAADSLSLAMRASHERSLALLIDTAIESRRRERIAREQAGGGGRRH